MHFAASIEVEESVSQPDKYFENNVLNTAKLLAVMAEYGVKNFIFSSTCAVYGEQEIVPINETAKVAPNNPYGYSKLIAERVIKYYCQFLGLRAVVFRYFNACGCDFDGLIQATHSSHLIAKVLDVAVGKTPALTVYGEDYNTFDGTCVRDYVHVLDIARAHVVALKKINEGQPYRLYNIGTGKGNSVLEIANQASEILNKIIPMQIGSRRAGDAPVMIADNLKLKNELNFELQYSDLPTIINTAWNQLNQADRM
jgi:UDP-glucose-4-epimerase GalE